MDQVTANQVEVIQKASRLKQKLKKLLVLSDVQRSGFINTNAFVQMLELHKIHISGSDLKILRQVFEKQQASGFINYKEALKHIQPIKSQRDTSQQTGDADIHAPLQWEVRKATHTQKNKNGAESLNIEFNYSFITSLFIDCLIAEGSEAQNFERAEEQKRRHFFTIQHHHFQLLHQILNDHEFHLPYLYCEKFISLDPKMRELANKILTNDQYLESAKQEGEQIKLLNLKPSKTQRLEIIQEKDESEANNLQGLSHDIELGDDFETFNQRLSKTKPSSYQIQEFQSLITVQERNVSAQRLITQVPGCGTICRPTQIKLKLQLDSEK